MLHHEMTATEQLVLLGGLFLLGYWIVSALLSRLARKRPPAPAATPPEPNATEDHGPGDGTQ